MFKEYDVIHSAVDLTPLVRKGTRGVILLVLCSGPEVYEVEFFDDDNETLELLTVEGGDLLV